jgi:hypothetical protein
LGETTWGATSGDHFGEGPPRGDHTRGTTSGNHNGERLLGMPIGETPSGNHWENLHGGPQWATP